MLYHLACTASPSGVKVLGIFSGSDKATSACTERTDFYFPLTLDSSFRDLGEDVAALTPVTYPRIESEAEARALAGAW